MNINSEGLVVTMSGKEVIPERSEELKTRLCVIAHSGGRNSAGDLSVCEELCYSYVTNVFIALQQGAG